MKRLYPLLSICAVLAAASLCLPQPAVAGEKPAAVTGEAATVTESETESTAGKDLPLEVDLKWLPSEDGYVGLDYRLDLSSTIKKDPKTGRLWDAFFQSRGYLTGDTERNDIDSIVAETGISFFPLWRKPFPESPPRDPALPFDIEPDDADLERARTRVATLQSPFVVYADGHGRFESTQDLDTYNFAAGASLAVTTSSLNKILDFPFRWLHGDRNNPRHLDVEVSYDYLLSQTVEEGAEEAGENRLSLAAEWETGILDSDRLRFTFASYYDLDGGGSDSDFHPFFEVRYLHRLIDQVDAKVSFSIKYVVGELPPNYEQGHMIGGGLSIEF